MKGIKRYLSMVLSVCMILGVLSSCGDKNSVLNRIKAGETVAIQVNAPSFSEEESNKQPTLDWVELGEINTYREFRQAFNDLFNVNIVTSTYGNTRQGCMFNINKDGEDVQSNNTTMRDTFRNKKFNEYWESKEVKSEISKLIVDVYKDVEIGDYDRLYAVLNAYFNLFGSENETNIYNGEQVLTREQFSTLVYKAGFGVGTLKADTSGFKKAGYDTYYMPYLAELAPYGFLKVEDGSLNMSNVKTPITKLEAIYLITNLYFSDYVDRVIIEKKQMVYGYKNDPLMLVRSGITGEGTSSAVENNLLAYLIDKQGKTGIDESVTKYLLTAEKLGLTAGINVDLFGPITKNETIQLLINAYTIENVLRGYLTNTEYGRIEYDDIDK